MKGAIEAAAAFGAGTGAPVAPLGRGNIHDTFLVGGPGKGFVLQRLSASLGADPELLMRNAARVCAHWAKKENDPRRRLTPLAAEAGVFLWRDKAGRSWRAFERIEDSVSLDRADTPEQAREAGTAFGRFLRLMGDLPVSELAVPLPNFHDGLKRCVQFERALAADAAKRASGCRAETAFISARKSAFSAWAEDARGGRLPERVVHNDTKIGNVLFDAASGKALCVVDLDTVMPGWAPFDFGDLVRSTVTGRAEDERDLAALSLRMDIFSALAGGFLSEAGPLLSAFERSRLVAGTKTIALELGMRFLTDHLSGDRYFKIGRPNHNLDRARTQFKIAELIENSKDELEAVIAGFPQG